MGYWLRGHEGERNKCVSKIQQVGLKLDIKDLRPVSSTSPVAKILEGFSAKSLFMCVWDKLDSKQFALPGRSTTQALVYLLHTILESVDGGEMYVRMFFSDFSKGFDLVDHNVCCVNWIP